MSGPKTPRASLTYYLWLKLTEDLAARLEPAAHRFLVEGNGDLAGEAHCLAARARALGEATLEWAHREPDEERAEVMSAIVSLNRRAEELLGR